jgi:hypothetical protein
MSALTIERYRSKVERKIAYLDNIGKKFNDHDLLELILNLKNDYENIQHDQNDEINELAYKSQNKKLKIMKKKYENIYFNKMSNTKAFMMKAELKNYQIVTLMDKFITKFETKANFPDFTDVNARVYEYPQDILAMEFKKVLVKNNPSSEISLEKISNFILQIVNSYNPVSYHNFSHAFSVAQMFYCMAKKTPSISKLLSNDLVFTGLISCISHDLCHRKNN